MIHIQTVSSWEGHLAIPKSITCAGMGCYFTHISTSYFLLQLPQLLFAVQLTTQQHTALFTWGEANSENPKEEIPFWKKHFLSGYISVTALGHGDLCSYTYAGFKMTPQLQGLAPCGHEIKPLGDSRTGHVICLLWNNESILFCLQG